MRLLLAEDERELSRALTAILEHSHFSVDAVYDGQEALEYALVGEYDGIVLDVMMPKLDGFQVVEKLRRAGKGTPVLMLTARPQTMDKVEGLDRGADDYLTKPFEVEELLARVRALTRRRAEYTHSVLELGNIRLNKATFELIGPGEKSFRLGNREFQMLEMLLMHPGAVFSTEQFLSRIWGYDAEAEINVVWVNISALRKKLNALGADVEICAHRGVGYSLEGKR